MARVFNNFENITMGDFIPFTEGYHLVTITGHKEGQINNKDVDIFELTSDTGATTNFTLYWQENCQWCYKKLMHCCGAKIEDMKGNVTVDFSKLIGKRFGAMVKMEQVEKWDESKMQNVTKNYPRVNAGEIYTEQRTRELMATYTPPVREAGTTSINANSLNANNMGDMTPVIGDADIPF